MIQPGEGSLWVALGLSWKKERKKVTVDSRFEGEFDMEICLLLIWSSTNYSQTEMLNEKEETLTLIKIKTNLMAF